MIEHVVRQMCSLISPGKYSVALCLIRPSFITLLSRGYRYIDPSGFYRSPRQAATPYLLFTPAVWASLEA